MIYPAKTGGRFLMQFDLYSGTTELLRRYGSIAYGCLGGELS